MRIHVLAGAMIMLCASAAFGQSRERAGALFDRADSNGDGTVGRDEFLTARAEQFGSRDRNGDGFIDGADFGERASARPRISQALNAMITQLDADKDGKVSKDEFVNGGAASFDRVDADKSGSLDAKEREAAKQALRERAGR
jgi:Ca2+-binding EF-hand superfamily protein